MITRSQIFVLAKDCQIDENSIAREFLQLVFLSYLYREPSAKKIYFKGGTAIHLLLGSARFSEDLDFSVTLNRKELKETISRLEKAMQKELVGVKILPVYFGKNGLRFRLKYQNSDFKYPLNLRLDFSEEKINSKTASALVTKFPIVSFPIVSHLSPEEILAEKIRALLERAKGRDFFDLWFLLEKGIGIDTKLVVLKMKNTKTEFSKESLLNKVQNYSSNEVKRDLIPFLPIAQRKIVNILKDRLLINIKSKL